MERRRGKCGWKREKRNCKAWEVGQSKGRNGKIRRVIKGVEPKSEGGREKIAKNNSKRGERAGGLAVLGRGRREEERE